MAFYRTIVARTGCESEMAAHIGFNLLVGQNGQWLGPVADEDGVVEAATDYFEASSHDYVVAPDSVEVRDFYDFTGEIRIGWRVCADGVPAEDN
jgi:hypothetical protein